MTDREGAGDPNQLGDGPSGVRVKCRQCGSLVELDRMAIGFVAAFNSILEQRYQPLLAGDELVVCDRPDCQAAEREQLAAKSHAEEREVLALLADVRAGKFVCPPDHWRTRRPSDLERVLDAIRSKEARDASVRAKKARDGGDS